MRRTILLASAFAFCVAAPAFAAPSAHNWTGFYLGVNAGYGGDKFTYPVEGSLTDIAPDEDADETVLDAHAKLSNNSSGFVGGGQVGYDYDFGSWVLGAVADIDATGIEGKIDASGAVSGLFDASASAHAGSKIDYFGTVRARLGVPVADGRFLPYVTAGLAYGQVTSSAGVTFATGSISPTSLSISHHTTQTGWTVGAGADYAITPHWRFGVEYLYADLGTHTLIQGSVDIPAVMGVPMVDGDEVLSGSVKIKSTTNVVRATLNYQF